MYKLKRNWQFFVCVFFAFLLYLSHLGSVITCYFLTKTMTKKQLFILIGALILVILLVWGIFYAWNTRLARKTDSPSQMQGAPITNSNGKQPPTLPTAPISGTPGIQTYSGKLLLTTAVAQLQIDNQTYPLVTNPQSNFVATLAGRGFVNGDKVAVMGKVVAGQLVVSGLNKLAQ